MQKKDLLQQSLVADVMFSAAIRVMLDIRKSYSEGVVLIAPDWMQLSCSDPK
ncbi:hypothetical protein [Burkholderia stabilis]|uniref:hypothetical protein n=1 Tax=Burkholderia stabilis TaxID=95485 RepID=UPI001F4A2819|nr:hypothetical protein [Burkholderia stabilis]